MAEINIDATNAIAGRLASYAAKQALLGNTVNIFNSEKAVITGKKAGILEKQQERLDRGIPTKGPFIQKQSDRFLRRMIRGMLPYKQAKGKEAFHRVMCYIGVPAEFANKKLQKAKGTNVLKSNAQTFVPISKISKFLGGEK